MPVYECDDKYDSEDHSSIVEIFCTLMEVLVKAEGEHEEARGDEEPNAGYPTYWLGEGA